MIKNQNIQYDFFFLAAAKLQTVQYQGWHVTETWIPQFFTLTAWNMGEN